MVRWLEAWARRTGFVPPGRGEEILDASLGALWLELLAEENPERNWPSALRRVLYQDLEKPRRRGRNLNPAGMATSPSQGEPRRREGFSRHSTLAEKGLEPSARAQGVSRRMLKVRLARLWTELADDPAFLDLEKRHRRQLARAQREGSSPRVKREARSLLRLAGWMELPPSFGEFKIPLTTLAARKQAGPTGNQESSIASGKQHARGESR